MKKTKKLTVAARKPLVHIKAALAAAKQPADKFTGTGFVAFVDGLILTPPTGAAALQVVHGFVRSRYSVDEAVRLVLAKYPDKAPSSVKRIVKVRPRHLERQKLSGFDQKKVRAPRWRWTGPGAGTGYAARIDALLEEGKSPEAVAALVTREFGRLPKLALTAVRARVAYLARRAAIKPRPAPKAKTPKQERAAKQDRKSGAVRRALTAVRESAAKLARPAKVTRKELKDGTVVTVVEPAAVQDLVKSAVASGKAF